MHEKDSVFIFNSRNRCCIYIGFARKIVNSKSNREADCESVMSKLELLHYYVFRAITMNSLSLKLIYLESISLLQNRYKFTIFFAILLSKHYLFREFSMNSLSASQFLFKFTIVFGNSL